MPIYISAVSWWIYLFLYPVIWFISVLLLAQYTGYHRLAEMAVRARYAVAQTRVSENHH